MKTFKIPVEWTVSAVMEVRAETLEEAILKADDMALPTDTDYIEGSFSVNEPMLEYYAENEIKI